jgi:hypothetical protein
MKFILGKDRNQTKIICLDQLISDNHEVRLIDIKSVKMILYVNI